MGIATLVIVGAVLLGVVSEANQPGTPPRQLSGAISNADYPPAAIRAGAEGIVQIRLSVAVDGRVTSCAVAASSGNAALDSTSCALAQRRYRYVPAMRGGRPVAGIVDTSVRWTLPLD